MLKTVIIPVNGKNQRTVENTIQFNEVLKYCNETILDMLEILTVENVPEDFTDVITKYVLNCADIQTKVEENTLINFRIFHKVVE